MIVNLNIVYFMSFGFVSKIYADDFLFLKDLGDEYLWCNAVQIVQATTVPP